MMQQKESAARRALRKKRARKRAIRLAGAAALAAALGALTVCVILPGMDGGQGTDEPKAQEQTATAALGTIEKTVFGAGEVQSARQPGVYAQTDGKIAEYLVEVGDSVKAGDVVARLENDELDAEIAQLEYDLQTAQQAVRATQTHTQYVYKQLYDDEGYPRFDTETGEPLLGQYSNEITIRAPADGLIKAVYIEKGDDALAVYREYGAVMLLSASGNARVLALFGMSVGTSVTIIDYVSRIFTPIESLGMEIQTIQSAMAGVKRIDAFLAQPERDIPAPREESAACGDVVLSHVTFGYSERTVLSDLSFTVKQGEQVTLVGRTGAGKSTVFRLLLGLYRPQAGKIAIGGVDVSAITDEERRACIGCVEQHFARVPGTVLDQITLGDARITRAMAENAAQLAGLDEVIRALPNGYDTLCADGLFSQGEWQLLSIARAAAANPAVLLLDEITANLDAETEARVLDALRRASKGRTVLSISHRIYESLGGHTIEIKALEG